MKGRSRDMTGYDREPSAEPVRLLAGGGSAYQRRLLESAELDVMPSATPERLARALGAGEASAGRHRSEGAGSTRWGSRRWVRLGAVGGLGGLGIIVASVAALLAGSPGAPEDAASGGSTLRTPPASAPARVELPSVSAPERPLVESPVASPATAPEAPPAQLAPPRPRVAAPAAAPRRPAPAAGGLLEEVRLLERVRSALRAGQSSAARRLLDEYRARFVHGELGFEAQLLEAERASLDGDATRARQLARQLLARPGAARYRPRLERLLRAEATRAQDEGSVRAGADMETRRSNP